MSLDNITTEQWDSMSYVQNKEQDMPSIDTKDSTTWVRDNSAKPDPTLVCPEMILGAARALTYGCQKYSRNNFLKGDGMPLEVVLASMQRHLLAYQAGEDHDDESGLSHLDHVGANLSMLVALVESGKKREQ